MSKSVNQILSSLNSKSKSLAESGAKYNENMQAHILNILEFIQEHGDSTAATTLVTLVTRQADVNALKAWFSKHANLAWNEAKEATAKKPALPARFTKRSKPENFEIDMDAAIADKWYDIKAAANADAPRKAYNAVGRIATILRTLASINGEVEGDNFSDELISDLRDVFLKHGGQLADITPANQTEPVAENTDNATETVKAAA